MTELIQRARLRWKLWVRIGYNGLDGVGVVRKRDVTVAVLKAVGTVRLIETSHAPATMGCDDGAAGWIEMRGRY